MLFHKCYLFYFIHSCHRSYTKAPFWKNIYIFFVLIIFLALKRYSKFKSMVEHNVSFSNTHHLFYIICFQINTEHISHAVLKKIVIVNIVVNKISLVEEVLKYSIFYSERTFFWHVVNEMYFVCFYLAIWLVQAVLHGLLSIKIVLKITF